MGIGRSFGWVNVHMTKFQELLSELKFVLSGKGSQWIDSLLPLFVFLIVLPFLGNEIAIIIGVGIAIIFFIFRFVKRDSLVYTLGGLGSVILAWIFILLSGSDTGFVLPGLISGAVTIVICVVSVMFNRPLVAWTSYIARRWPLKWYWHPKVLPAYNEVTIAWAVLFTFRLVLKYYFFQQGAVEVASWLEIVLGWPFTIALLVLSYLYGRWRLNILNGPSVEEFKAGAEPPWEGQQRGF